jgi:CHAT domain-containing protein
MFAKLYCRWLTVVAALLSLTTPFGSETMASARLLSARQVDRHFEQRMEAARAARDARQPVDCFVEAVAAQEIIAAYRGNIERQSIVAMTLADRCLIDAGSRETVASTIKEKLGAAIATSGEGSPPALQLLRALVLLLPFTDKPALSYFADLHAERLRLAVGEDDPRYPVALTLEDQVAGKPPVVDIHVVEHVEKRLEKVRKALALQRRIFGPSHPVVADSLWMVANHVDFLAYWVRGEHETEAAANARAITPLEEALAAQRKARGDWALETALAAQTLAGRVEGKRRIEILRLVHANMVRRRGAGSPDALFAEFGLSLAQHGAGTAERTTALRSIAARAIALEDAGSAEGLTFFKILTLNFEDLDRERRDQPPLWLEEVDQLYATGARLDAKLRGGNPFRQLRAHLGFRQLHGSALLKQDGLTQRFHEAALEHRRSGGELAGGQRVERDLSMDFLLVADVIMQQADRTGWLPPADIELGYAALQESLVGATTAAFARSAARRAAGTVSEQLSELVARREALRQRLHRIDENFMAAERRPDEAGLSALRTELAAVDQRLGKEFPDYFALVRPEALTVAQTRALLGPDEALVMLVPDIAWTHVFAVNRDGAQWVRVRNRSPGLDMMVKRLLWDLRAPVEIDKETEERWLAEEAGRVQFSRATALRLYRELFGPITGIIEGRGHLHLVQGGILASLPLGVLVTAQPAGDDADPEALRKTPWLAERHTLSMLPSVQSLALMRARTSADGGPRRGEARFAGFGDPKLEGQALTRGISAAGGRPPLGKAVMRSADGGIDLRNLRALSRLPGTARELNEMAALFGSGRSLVFLGDRATENMVKTTSLENRSLIVFATHGVLAGELDGAFEPGLVLTPPAQASEADDGYLNASEIAALRLDADWVILSACNTGAGDGWDGAAGLSGLARSFFYAGARSLLVSHWPVRDDVAARLTVDAIRRQRSDPSVDAARAFRDAMRAIREDRSQDGQTTTFAHPNAWAPFSLIGDVRSIGGDIPTGKPAAGGTRP